MVREFLNNLNVLLQAIRRIIHFPDSHASALRHLCRARKITPSCGSLLICPGSRATPNPAATKLITAGSRSASCRILGVKPASRDALIGQSLEPG